MSDLEFEPDVILVTATSGVATNGTRPPRTNGWSYGKAHRVKRGRIRQNVVSVSDDRRSNGGGVGAADDGRVLHLRVHDGKEIRSLMGSVTRMTASGFVVAVDAPNSSTAAGDQRHALLFEAFAFTDDAHVEVGHFTTLDRNGVQTVSLGQGVDHIVLTGCTAIDALDDRSVTNDLVGVCHGTVSGHDASDGSDDISQRAVTSVVDPGSAGGTTTVATDEAALALVHGSDGQVTGRTTARATAVGRTLHLEYEETAGESLVTYVAMQCGDEQEPELGTVRLPASDEGAEVVSRTTKTERKVRKRRQKTAVQFLGLRDKWFVDPRKRWSKADIRFSESRARRPKADVRSTGARVKWSKTPARSVRHRERTRAASPKKQVSDDSTRVSVELGFRPGMIEFTACDIDALDDERSVVASPLSFGWSHGVAMPTRRDTVEHYGLHGSFDPRRVPSGSTSQQSTDAVDSRRTKRRARDDTSTVLESTAAAVHVLDSAGRILGRDEVRVVDVTDTGFELAVTGIDSPRRADSEKQDRPLVFYTAWPEVSGREPKRGAGATRGGRR